MQSLSDILSGLSAGAPSASSQFGGQQPSATPAIGSGFAPPSLDATGQTLLPAAAPGNILARLQQRAAAPAAPITTPQVFSGAPNVQGMSKGSAFATGLAGGLADASKSGILANEIQAQQQQQQLEAAKTVLGQQNTEATLAEQKKRDATLDQYYKNLVDPDVQRKLAEVKDTDYVAQAQTDAQKLGWEPGSPQYQDLMRTAAFKNAGGTAAATAKAYQMNPTEEKAYGAQDQKVQMLSGALDSLKEARSLNDQVDNGTWGAIRTAAVNKMGGADLGGLFGLDAKKAAVTTNFNNAITGGFMSGAKDLFCARVSNYEEQLMQNLSPNSGIAPEARGQILDRVIARKQQALGWEIDNRDAMKAGTYFQKGAPTRNPYESWNADKDMAIGGKTAPAAAATSASAPPSGTAPAAPPAPSSPSVLTPTSATGGATLGPGPSAPDGLPIISDPAAARKLLPGTLFKTPDGATRRVRGTGIQANG